MTASPSSCASTSSCASEPSPPRGTSLPSTSQWVSSSGPVDGQIKDKDVCVAQVLGGRAGDAVAQVWTHPGDEHSQHPEHWPPETGSTGHQTALRRFPCTFCGREECVYIRVCWFQITRRYAEFSSAIVSINQTFPNERTNLLLGQLQVHQRSQNPSALTPGTPPRPHIRTLTRYYLKTRGLLQLYICWVNVSRWRWKILCWRWQPSSPPGEISSSSSSTTMTWCSASSWWAH